MESCYIPNNPQYGLSLEYTAYSGGSSFNGTITGFTAACNPISDGILCCQEDLQSCECEHLGRLKQFDEHCHLRCNAEECNDSIQLGDCDGGIDLQNCRTRLNPCDRLESCNAELVHCDNNIGDGENHLIDSDSSLTNCDSQLVKCDNHIINYQHHLTNPVDCLSDCDNRLIEDSVQLRCDEHNVATCNDRLVECDIGHENCTEQINITQCDESLDNCEGRIEATDNRFIGRDRILTHSKEFSGKCNSHLEKYKNCERSYLNSQDECENSLEECHSHIVTSVERLQDTEGQFDNCNTQLEDSNHQLVRCEEHFRECEDQLGECDEQLDGDERLGFEEYRDLGSGGPGTGYWIPDEMASCSFSLPPLDLDPLPSLFPFSPCSGNYKNELKEKQPNEVADVLLSLKHAVVHPGAELGTQYSQQELAIHPQMVMGGAGCYDSCGPGVFPTMSVNVSMNMTMHGYPPEQMCPQMQWNQSSPPPMNMMYSQNQGVISPSPYPGSTTYSFTADFRGPTQSDPLITATSSFKPIQITSSQKSQQGTNYNIFSQKPVQANFTTFNHSLTPRSQNFGSPNHSHLKTRSPTKDNQLNVTSIGPTYQIIGQNQNHMSPHSLGYSHIGGNGNSVNTSIGKVQIGSLSGCSAESDDEQKPNLCRICGKTYARPSTLKTHLRTHSGERPYRCSDCNKSFSQAANLTAHVRTHTGQKPFSCQICHRRFSQSSSVTTHMRTHSGERPYRCRACKKAFSDSSTLTKHLRIHSGEKPYQCKLCFLRFSQSGNLNRHMRVHGNNAAHLG